MKLRALAVLFLAAVWAAGASGSSFPNNYAAYQTLSFDPTGFVVVNVTITGTTLPPVPNMPGAYHQGQVNLVFNGGSNWQYGQQVCTSCNVNFNGYWSFSENDTCFLDLIGCSLETIPQVSCSFYGVFWQGGGGGGGYDRSPFSHNL